MSLHRYLRRMWRNRAGRLSEAIMKLQNRGHWGHLQMATLAHSVEQLMLTYVQAHIRHSGRVLYRSIVGEYIS